MAVVSIKNKLRRGNLLVGNEAYDPGGMVPIATVSVGGSGSSSIEFTSIPSTYTHLQIRAFVRTNRSTYNVDVMLAKFNSDTTSGNYARHNLYANNNNFPGTVTAEGSANALAPLYISANNGSAPFSAYIIDILDYANTNKYKTMRALGGADSNGDVSGFSTTIMFASQLWKNTNAITSVTFTPEYGTSFNQYSHFALYGIKSA